METTCPGGDLQPGLCPNGNLTEVRIPDDEADLSYSPDNRLRWVHTLSDGDEYYVYAPAGDRVWKKTVTTSTAEKLFFNGPDGRRLGEYKLVVKGGVKSYHQGGAKGDHFGPFCGVG